MERDRFTTIAHRDHVYCNPIDPAKLDAMLLALELPRGARVLDAGCGKGEALIRLIELSGARGVGVDTNAAFLAEAGVRLGTRVPRGELTLHHTRVADAPLAPASFDAALCLGSTHVFGGYRETLRALATLVRPGGRVLIAEGFWRRAPAPEYLAHTGIEREEFGDRARLFDDAADAGFTPLGYQVASEDDWDAYEDLYASSIESWCERHPDDPDRDAMLDRIRHWREGYLRWGRVTLGFALMMYEH